MTSRGRREAGEGIPVPQQARSSSVTTLVSFTGLRRAADAAVEARVRIIRRALGLRPPESS